MTGVQRFIQPDYSDLAQTGSIYPINIDRSIAALSRVARAFAPHQLYTGSPSPDNALEIDAGFLWDGSTMVEVPAQITGAFLGATAGSAVRIDRVMINASTGAALIVSGTPATGSPSAVPPAILAGYFPCCQVTWTSSTPIVLNSMITDERAFANRPPSWTLISSVEEISGAASIDFTTLATGSNRNFSRYVLSCSRIVPQTDNTALWLRLADATGFYATAIYDYSQSYNGSVGGASVVGATAATKFEVVQGLGSSTGESLDMAFDIYNSHLYKHVYGAGAQYSQSPQSYLITAAATVKYTGGGGIEGIRLLMSSGNIMGRFDLYGVQRVV